MALVKDDLPYSELGDRLRRIREQVGETQKMMSSRLGLGPTTWQRLEAGSNAPSGETLLAIAALGYDPTWVLTGKGAMSLPQSAERDVEGAPFETGKRSASSAIDDELFGRVTDAIARLYKAEHIALAPVDLGRLAARGYTRIIAATDDPSERFVMVKMLTSDLRAELHAMAAEPGTGKHSA